MKKLKLLRIVGARPQFMQVKPLRKELQKRGHKEILLHTGQHYDDAMSKQFFIDLGLPEADVNLGVGSGNHGEQTARMLEGIEKCLLHDKYDAVIVDGDTNSTLAGALAATKLHIPVIHVEAGMRSYNKLMPEEINRTLTDHVSTLLFCPSERNKENLHREGITHGVYVVGDVFAECFSEYKTKALELQNQTLSRYRIEKEKYILLTLHRAENVDNKEKISYFLNEVSKSPLPVVWPIHPRTKRLLEEFGLTSKLNEKVFKLISPVGYLEMLALESSAFKILTDSGGVQREAYYWRKPSVIMRDTTEWTEIVDSNWATLFDIHDPSSKLWGMPAISESEAKDLYKYKGVSAEIVRIIEEALL
ncbi:non-hydrolyzing UDP-N-acetylglucosamine 2-epimerase [Schinkia azotoformans]|uniref:non-hydrolyzing UDP-N-acetylglucosamine 2-epimerase n=1 Tax=Schinkia azotoformans TaxID=1454 RepID=UPI002DBB9E97|nr:UDP-N-acetylglucosamine 2-epimerase (non-hydrolyzing) [Schinkia azotoformans]MEC1714814.1 UDP-N-acetylglucosamine 2-epimerase (non-hydrolyzing) [Schinkia azotoformans]MEC1741720.1 UDP-N-acetylglucosamine 2-epimerase (non-hydrolyzing) [Schinkia azotoformans]MEC1766602.1 UDP-N-acetylglucosamine 2-epimerase (non-hydrolyzing) [Schinkia azotoformans]MEC1788017.1 UDP-N-acetylglucosamine 2-epimerase (non-hydrolyzing) [Schinkia azotoformans]MED4375417.1 UDP-N-acetylglucosamine 2-epimerase (non-hydr